MFSFKRILTLSLLIASFAINANSKGVKTPKYKNYQSFTHNAGWVNSSSLTLEVNYITPVFREQVYEYSGHKLNSKIEKQKRKFKDKPEKLAKELSERQYMPLFDVPWDKPNNDVVLLGIPHLVPAQNVPIRNSHQATSIAIYDKDDNLVCKPSKTSFLKKKVVYAHLTQVYSGKFYFKSKGKKTTYDEGFSPIIGRFPLKCFEQDKLVVVFGTKSKVISKGKIPKKVLKQIRADY